MRLARAEVPHQLVQLLKGLRRGQLEHGQGVDRGAQPAHGHRGSHTVPGHVPHDKRHPRAGQRDRLVPVAADLDHLAAGQVAVPHLDRRRLGQPGRQQAALQGHRGGPLPAVPAGVVDEDRRPGRELHADLGVVRVEGPVAVLAGADHEAERDVARGQREQQHRGVGQQVGHRPAQPRGRDPRRLVAAHLQAHRLAGGHALGVRRARRVAQDLPGREHRVPGRVAVVVGHREPAQQLGAVRAVGRQFLPGHQALQDQQPGLVGEVRHSDVDEFAGQLVDVQRAADPLERAVQERVPHHRRVQETALGRRRDPDQHQADQARVAGAHRLDGDHRIQRVAVPGPERQHGRALAAGQRRAQQALQGYRVRRGTRQQAAELNAEQGVAGVSEHVRGIPVVLEDPAGFVDTEGQRPRRGVGQEGGDLRGRVSSHG